jgi:mono/diheme cytochrome c family protein
MTLRAIMFCAFSLGAALDLPAEAAEGMARVSISLPPETAQLKTGPGKEYAEQHCQICHSVD